jgi:hypothetical protein
MKYLKAQEISQFRMSGNIFILLMASVCDHRVKHTTAPSRDVHICFCNQAIYVVTSNGSANTSKKTGKDIPVTGSGGP